MTQTFNISQWARDYGQRTAQASTIQNLTPEQRTQLAHRIEYNYKLFAQKLCGLITLVTAVVGFVFFKPLLIVAGLALWATVAATKSINNTGVFPACLNRLLPDSWYEANHPARVAYLRAHFGLPEPVVAPAASGVSAAPAQPAAWKPESFFGLWKNPVPLPTTPAGFGEADPTLSNMLPLTPETQDDILVTLLPYVVRELPTKDFKDALDGIFTRLNARGVRREEFLNLLEQNPTARRTIVAALADRDLDRAFNIYYAAVPSQGNANPSQGQRVGSTVHRQASS